MATQQTEHPISAPVQGRRRLHLDRLHDLVFSEANLTALKHVVIKLSIAGFVLHLALIFLAHSLAHPELLIAIAGDNYLAAISTPFNFILFYEVLTLIGALHASTTQSIANQFEIVSLIYIREVFKDMSSARAMMTERPLTAETLPLFVDMATGLTMYLLVAIFQHLAQKQARHATLEHSPARARFVAQKKGVALGLAVLLLAMAAWNIGIFVVGLYRSTQTGHLGAQPVTTFYNDLFTVMIFTDVLILILSLVVSGRYESVFRNAAFVVSIIVIRFALTEEFPYRAPMALVGMVFAILTLLVYDYHTRLLANHDH